MVGDEDTVFARFADQHGLALQGEAAVPELTPLLVRGHSRAFRPLMTGTLPGGVEGSVGLYEYVVIRRRRRDRYSFAVATTSVPESAALIPRLICEDPERPSDGVYPAFDLYGEKVWQESEALERRYRITVGPHQDENWLRQLFSPTFIVWLAEDPPKDFAFELVYGAICASLPATGVGGSDLDRLCECTAAIARRLREECAEEEVA